MVAVPVRGAGCIRWYDAIQPKKRETRTGEQIVADVIKKAGLKVVSKAESV